MTEDQKDQIWDILANNDFELTKKERKSISKENPFGYRELEHQKKLEAFSAVLDEEQLKAVEAMFKRDAESMEAMMSKLRPGNKSSPSSPAVQVLEVPN